MLLGNVSNKQDTSSQRQYDLSRPVGGGGLERSLVVPTGFAGADGCWWELLAVAEAD